MDPYKKLYAEHVWRLCKIIKGLVFEISLFRLMIESFTSNLKFNLALS